MVEESNVSEFERDLARFFVTNEYCNAFAHCLKNLESPVVGNIAFECANILIEDKGTEILYPQWNYKFITVSIPITIEWLLDVAINNQIGNLTRTTMTKGLWRSLPAIEIGGIFDKQTFAVCNNKDGTTTLYYKYSCLTSDLTFFTLICKEIVKTLYGRCGANRGGAAVGGGAD